MRLPSNSPTPSSKNSPATRSWKSRATTAAISNRFATFSRRGAMAPKVILTGFMATGKSVVSRALAKRLGWPLVDFDALLEQRTGGPISIIFSESGETHFRKLERDLIDEITAYPRRGAQGATPRPPGLP